MCFEIDIAPFHSPQHYRIAVRAADQDAAVCIVRLVWPLADIVTIREVL